MKFLCIGIEDIGFRAGLNLNSEIRLVVGQSLHELHILVSGQEDLTNSLNVLLLNTRCRHELLRYVRLYICQHLRHRGFLSLLYLTSNISKNFTQAISAVIRRHLLITSWCAKRHRSPHKMLIIII